MAIQFFLPVATQDNRLVAVVPISSTDFDGTETAMTVNSVSRPLKKIVIRQHGNTWPSDKFVMAIDMTHSEEVVDGWRGYSTSAMPIGDVWPYREWSVVTGSIPTELTDLGAVFRFLYGGSSIAVSAPTSSSTPTVTTPATLTWSLISPIANAPSLSFFDFNWVSLFAPVANSNVGDPPYIVVTGQPAGGLLKAVVLQVPETSGPQGGPVYNTVRIMKTTPLPIVAGDYVFTFVVYNSSGLASATATLTVTVTT